MKDTQTKNEIRGLQSGVSRIILNEGIVASQIEDLVHYAELALGLVDQAMEVPEGTTLVVRHQVLGDPIYTYGPFNTHVENGPSELDGEITLHFRNGSWEFMALDFTGRFGPAPWAYCAIEGEYPFWRHDGQIIEFRDEIEQYLRDLNKKGREVPRMRGTQKQLDDFKKLHQPAEIDVLETFGKKPVWTGIDAPKADPRSLLRRFIDWLKS